MPFSPVDHSGLGAIVIGCGGQGLRRAQAVRLATGWKLNGIYDTDTGRADTAAARLGCKSIANIESAMADRHTDVVIVATPPAFHDNLILQGLEAGKHVFCEKPLVIDSLKAIQFAELAASKNRILATGFNHRFYAPVMEAYEIVRNGMIGGVESIQARIGCRPDASALSGWLGNPFISGGGVLTDNGSHAIDLVRLFLGELQSVKSSELRFNPDHPGIDQHCESSLVFEDGIEAGLTCSWLDENAPYLDFNINGSAGSIHFSAFPFKLHVEHKTGFSRTFSYWGDRLKMKMMGRSAPGLESSLVRELSSVRRQIMGQSDQTLAMNHATGHDGTQAAATIEKIRLQAGRTSGVFNHDTDASTARSA